MNANEKLQNALVAQLNFWLGRSANDIQVTVEDGIVTLRGCVPGYVDKINCVEMVQRAGGVKAVVDDVIVRLPETRRRTDSEIATSAIDAINWLTTVPPGSLKITAQAGRLTLEGIVEKRSQKYAAEYAVRPLAGITGITNMITIRPQPLQREVKAAIEFAFERHAWLDARMINVEASGTKVVLRGNISSIAEREEAECAARTVRGVSAVENHIVIAA